MDGLHSVAGEASKEPNLLVIFLMICCVAMVCQVMLKAFEMIKDAKRSKQNGDVTHGDIKNDVYRAADKIMASQREANEQINWLKDAHNARDNNGRFLWWSDPGLKDALRELTLATKENTRACTEMIAVMKAFGDKADRVLYQGR